MFPVADINGCSQPGNNLQWEKAIYAKLLTLASTKSIQCLRIEFNNFFTTNLTFLIFVPKNRLNRDAHNNLSFIT